MTRSGPTAKRGSELSVGFRPRPQTTPISALVIGPLDLVVPRDRATRAGVRVLLRHPMCLQMALMLGHPASVLNMLFGVTMPVGQHDDDVECFHATPARIAATSGDFHPLGLSTLPSARF